jgi:DNA-binding PadR family transcriptional regulator
MMPMSEEPDLSPGEWAVLGLLAEGPAHGFALAKLLAQDGAVGQAWRVPRPLVYRALTTLAEMGLAEVQRAETGNRGPQREVYGATPKGLRAVLTWLGQPVSHPREVRSLLMLKLALAARGGLDPSALLRAQRDAMDPIVHNLNQRLHMTSGFDRTLALWRVESARGVQRFVDDLIGQGARERTSPPSGSPLHEVTDQVELPVH